MSFNPIHNLHWLKRIFFDSNRYPNVSILKTTYIDNKFLDDEYIQQLNNLQSNSEYHYTVYCLGDWGTTGELVYTNWDVVQFDIDQILQRSNYNFCGQDFGYIDPNATCLVAVVDTEIYICAEIYQTKRNTIQLAQSISQHPYISKYPIIADSAAPMQIAQLQRNGINVRAISKKTIKEGINNLKTRKIHVHPSCTNFINQISTYSYVKDKKTGEYTQQIADSMNHLMDALRYATQQLFIQKKHFGIGQ